MFEYRKRISDEFLFRLTDAKISSLEEIEEIEFELFAYEGTNMKDIITQGDIVIVHLN